MKKQTDRYKGGFLGFLGELRWMFGGVVGVIVAVVTTPEKNSVELGFLGLSLWFPFVLGGLIAILVAMCLKAIGVNSDTESDGQQ